MIIVPRLLATGLVAAILLTAGPLARHAGATPETDYAASLQAFRAELARLGTFLAYFDQINRISVALGQQRPADADAALRARTAAVYGRTYTPAEFDQVVAQHRQASGALFARIEQEVLASTRWPGNRAPEVARPAAKALLDRSRRQYEAAVGARQDPLAALQGAVSVRGFAMGSETPPPSIDVFAGQWERITGAMPSPTSREVVGQMVSSTREAAASATAPAAGPAAANSPGATSARPIPGEMTGASQPPVTAPPPSGARPVPGEMTRPQTPAAAAPIPPAMPATPPTVSPPVTASPNFEYGVDRRGGDYRSFDLTFDAPGLCAGQCAQEGQCRAWTYVKPGVQGPRARCWLKNVVPAQSRDANTISGLRTASAPQPATVPVPVPPAPAAARFLGCFKDTSVFDLNGHLERSAQNTPQRCVAVCRDRGFAYAAVQYGESCLCGNSYGRYGPASNCNYACTGDRGQVCGGNSANSVYSTGIAAAAPRAATPSARPSPATPASSARTCWDWYGEYLDGRTFTGHFVTFHVDGSKVASTWGWTGTWRTDGQRNFWIYWSARPDPNQADMLKLSADGRTLEGRNFETRLIRGTQRSCP